MLLCEQISVVIAEEGKLSVHIHNLTDEVGATLYIASVDVRNISLVASMMFSYCNSKGIVDHP